MRNKCAPPRDADVGSSSQERQNDDHADSNGDYVPWESSGTKSGLQGERGGSRSNRRHFGSISKLEQRVVSYLE